MVGHPRMGVEVVLGSHIDKVLRQVEVLSVCLI